MITFYKVKLAAYKLAFGEWYIHSVGDTCTGKKSINGF
jgi:hypothetical protein